MKPFDSTSYTIAHRPLHALVAALGDLSVCRIPATSRGTG
jgi:hypothetical protein